jgi:Sec-independent protein translocase protein TatA
MNKPHRRSPSRCLSQASKSKIVSDADLLGLSLKKPAQRSPSRSKTLSKDIDSYLDRSRSDLRDGDDAELLEFARSSLIELKTEALMFIGSSQRTIKFLDKDSANEDLQRQILLSQSRMAELMGKMRETMGEIRGQMETVDEKQKASEEEDRIIRENLVEIKGMIEELKENKGEKNWCTKTCRIM